MSKRGIKPVCVFLIYLMIILPIYASVSYAQFYGNVHGIDRVAGFRRVTQDLTTINVTAKSARTPGELMSSRFVLLGNPAQRFTCKYNNLTEYTDCETTIVEERPAGEHLYEVQLFNPDMQTFEFGKLMLRLLVDSTPPQALSFNVIRDGDNVSATYIVADRLCPTCPTSICSGIKKVSFIHNLQKIGEANFNTPYCSVQNKTLLSIPPGTSQRRICLRAEDRLGQTSENCKDILIDFEPPKLVNASLWTSAGKIQYYDGKPLGNVRLELYFQEDSPLNVSTLFADLSKLNTRPEFAAVYSQILGSDQAAMNRFQIECSNETEGEGLWKCEINNILMFIPLGGANPTITFTIKDIRENRYSDTFEIPLIFDGAAPVLTKISTGIADDKGRYWVTSNTENT
ncbi:TPA: hypothetical protein HA265_03820, partial [Candidatus Woesearchaeota archaeon]|nr:hypothetical protein [Candidatus Woesearchaeota archaeon]